MGPNQESTKNNMFYLLSALHVIYSMKILYIMYNIYVLSAPTTEEVVRMKPTLQMRKLGCGGAGNSPCLVGSIAEPLSDPTTCGFYHHVISTVFKRMTFQGQAINSSSTLLQWQDSTFSY